MAEYSIFGNGTPDLIASGDGSPINVATSFNGATLSGYTIVGVQIFIPAGTTVPSTGYVGYLWDGLLPTAGVLLGSANFGAVTPGTWATARFATPFTLNPAKHYRVSAYFPAGNYGAKTGVFSTAVKSADIELYANSDSSSAGNGSYAYGAAGSRCEAGGGGTWYGVDVLVDSGNDSGPSDGVTDQSSIADEVVAVRTGGPTSASFSASATDPLDVTTTDTHIGSIATSGGISTISRSMWENRISLSSLEFNASTRGPQFVNAPTQPNELGVEFRVTFPVRITKLRVYKAPLASGLVTATLWNNSGLKLSEATQNWVIDDGGWREFVLPSPVNLTAFTYYVASYYAPNGQYAKNIWVYNGMDYIESPFYVQAFNQVEGVNVHGSRIGSVSGAPHAFPTVPYHENYYIDPVAEWETDLPLAGPGYDQQFPNGKGSFGFPIAVFFPDPPWLEDYMSVGVNTAVGIPPSAPGYRDAILNSGMDVYAALNGQTVAIETTLADPQLGERVKGYFLADEPDMVHGYKTPEELRAQLAQTRRMDSTRVAMLNLGKWPSDSISYQWAPVAAGAPLVNENWLQYAAVPDILSCDSYSTTNPRLGTWAYVKQIGKMKQISENRVPIWGYVESCPVETMDPTPAQVVRTSWAMIIAGATGIVFFDHRFADAKYTQDFASLLHTPDMRAAVQAFCTEVQSVSGALATADVQHVQSVISSNKTEGPMGGVFGVPIHHMSKNHGGYRYLFAQSERPGSTNATFNIPTAANKTVTVLGESRTITVGSSGTFTDAFDEDYVYHIYRWTI